MIFVYGLKKLISKLIIIYISIYYLKDIMISYCLKLWRNVKNKKCNHASHDIIHPNNFQQNTNHPIFIKDIWFNIHQFLDDPKLKVACDCSVYKKRITIINTLLQTSKIFSILLGTELKSVNTWIYQNGEYKYKFDEMIHKNVIAKMNACKCCYPCENCPESGKNRYKIEFYTDSDDDDTTTTTSSSDY